MATAGLWFLKSIFFGQPIKLDESWLSNSWPKMKPQSEREWSWRAEKFVCLEAVFGSPMVQPRIKIRNQIVGPWRIFSSLFVSRETNPWPWNYVWLVHNFLMAKNVTAREIDEWSNQNLFQKILCLAVTNHESFLETWTTAAIIENEDTSCGWSRFQVSVGRDSLGIVPRPTTCHGWFLRPNKKEESP